MQLLILSDNEGNEPTDACPIKSWKFEISLLASNCNTENTRLITEISSY